MKRYALELNDAGLVLAVLGSSGEPQFVCENPGYASLIDTGVVTGAAATQRSRLQPLLVHNRFWTELNTEPLSRGNAGAKTNADLAYTQLTHVLSDRHEEGVALLLVIPAGYSREQLGLLLGVVQETGWTVSGLVDAAVAACAAEATPASCAHLDMQLHRTVLTSLGHDGHQGLQRTQFHIQLGLGFARIEQTWLQLIADAFVRQTRFDPLHQAASEQQLFDRLPQWLARLQTEATLTLELGSGVDVRRVEMHRDQFAAAAEPHYEALFKLLQSVRRASALLTLYVSARVAAMPGLLPQLAALADCEPHALPPLAAVGGALLNFDHVRRPAESLALVYRLPAQMASTAANAGPAIAPEYQPTHVLYSGRAWRISTDPLVLGWAVAGPARVLALPAGAPGVSRSHCTIVVRDGVPVLEDHSTYGTFVNDARVDGVSALRVGDVVRLGTPGVTVQLIQSLEDHGAA